ncbi:lysine--tRNA ligase [Angustibacter aerolatus]
MGVSQGVQGDWVAEEADRVVAEAERRGTPVVCASGISPSGPVHLGNLRELMTPHLVADEVRRRGVEARHVLSWDDFDRLRKVPAGVPESFAEHIGRPLTAVPDPCGQHASWAEHFKEPLRAALHELGVVVDEISQTQMYTSMAYREQVLHAMAHRADIDAVLGRYRTKGPDGGEPDGSDDASTGRDYFPYKPFCAVCGRDSTTVVGYDPASTELRWTCAFDHAGSFALGEESPGKLVWKVDWPMRWAFERVTFEAGGVDHSAPNSSYTVGSQIVREVFGGLPPEYLAYSFVGAPGTAKMSSSRGGAATPLDALHVVEAPVLRWLYTRRKPNQAITVSLDHEVGRLYDEWDALGRKLAGGRATPWETATQARSVRTAERELTQTPRPFPFRSLASVLDVTGGRDEQVLRILRDMAPEEPVADLDAARPRLDRARAWVEEYADEADRTRVRETPDAERLAALTDDERESLRLLVAGFDALGGDWTLDALTDLVYGVPKQRLGLPLDLKKPTPELRTAQRELFVLVYELLTGRDTGPRLPTLLLAIGPDRARALLDPARPA